LTKLLTTKGLSNGVVVGERKKLKDS